MLLSIPAAGIVDGSITVREDPPEEKKEGPELVIIPGGFE
jgi:hypothetical protein